MHLLRKRVLRTSGNPYLPSRRKISARSRRFRIRASVLEAVADFSILVFMVVVLIFLLWVGNRV